MSSLSKEDIEFLDAFFKEELTETALIELDDRLKNPDFKKYYDSRLEERYSHSSLEKLMAYLPMIILISLTLLGLYLIIK